jgi:hypothetical protein
MSDGKDLTRRDVLKASYVAPVILTLAVKPAFAQGGSGTPGDTQEDPIRTLPPIQQP